MKLLILITLMLLTSVVQAEKPLPEWAKEDGRTQGMGFIWFPGKFIHQDRVSASSMAIGRAVEYLIFECSVPHKNVKFHEKFERKVNGKWEVYLRASIKNADCLQAKRANVEYKKKMTNRALLKHYWTYKAFGKDFHIDTSICRRSNQPGDLGTLGCLEVADAEMKVGNFLKARAYAKFGCDLGDSYLCGLTGFINWEMGYIGPARAYLSQACDEREMIYCDRLDQLNYEVSKLKKLKK